VRALCARSGVPERRHAMVKVRLGNVMREFGSKHTHRRVSICVFF
jgi:hypothetical protein